MKKRQIFFAFAVICAAVLNSCAVTDYISKLFNKDKNVPPVEAPQEQKEGKQNNPEIQKPVEQKEKEPDNVVFARKLQELLNKGDLNGSIALYDDLPKKLQKDEDLQILLASLYISDGQYDKAIEVARKILEKNPDNFDALEIITIAARAKGNKAEYKAAANDLLAKDPDNAQANIMVGDEYLGNAKYKMALQSYAKALKTEPENYDAKYGYAVCSYYTDDVKTAKQISLELLEKEPDNDGAMSLLAKIYSEENKYAQAVELVTKAIEINPYNYNYYLELGLYQNARGQRKQAIAAWDKCIEIDSTYFLPFAYRAGCYDEMNDYENALYNYKKVIQTNPEYFYAYESAGVLEFHLGNYDSAREYFLTANKYYDNWCYKLLAAACYFKQGKTLDAKKLVQQTMKTLSRDSTEYLLVRFFNDSFSRNAEVTLTQRIQKEDDSTKRGKMLFYLGLYYEINGFDELAKEYYTKVAKMQAPMFFEYRFAEWGVQK